MSQGAAELLRARFILRDDAYARQASDGQYLAVKEPLTPAVLTRHLGGSLCVGVYQFRGSLVKWICIDVDGEAERADNAREAVGALVGTCRHFGLTSYVERSGKKGWHVWLFTQEVEGVLAQAIGRGLVAETSDERLIGCSEIAVFPKQTRVGDDAFGNLVKLPWGKRADNGHCGEFVDAFTLEALPRETQIELLAGAAPLAVSELRTLVEENGWNERVRRSALFSDEGKLVRRRASYGRDLPCYEALADVDGTVTITSGTRNKILFAFTSQQKRKGSSERVALRDLLALNRDKCRPPLDEDEVRKIVGSCYRSGESAAHCDTIQEARLCPVLTENALCPIHQAGLERKAERAAAVNADETRFTLQPLRKLATDPPLYTATVKGRDLELTLDELSDFQRFKKRCMAQLDFVPQLPVVTYSFTDEKGAVKVRARPCGWVWDAIVQEALDSKTDDAAPPEDASPRGVVWSEIRAFLTEGLLSENRDDLRKSYVVLTEVAGADCYVFRGEDLRRRLRLLKIDDLPISQVWKLIADRGGRNGAVDTPTHGKIRAYILPAASVRERGEAGNAQGTTSGGVVTTSEAGFVPG
jgi:hypothetical protein